MILDLNADVLPFMQLSADDGYGNVARIQGECETFFQSYCGRNFVSTAMQEIIRRVPGESIWLKEYPVISVQKLAVGSITALTVTNSNATTTAQVSVTATGVTLSYNYGAATSFLFATYTTLTALVAAINAAGSGWSASVIPGYEQTLSTELIPQMSLECINNTTAELAIPRQALSGYHLNSLTGEIDLVNGQNQSLGGYPTGRGVGRYPDFDLDHHRPEFIYANYTGGYAVIPNDLKLGILGLIKSVYDRVNEGTFGVSMYRIEGLQKIMNEDVPTQTRDMLELYKRRRF